MGVGAGIVLDSVAADEYAECLLKASFLTGADPGFELFETMYATREAVFDTTTAISPAFPGARGISASPSIENQLQTLLDERCRRFDEGKPYRLRVALDKGGRIALTHAPLAPLAADSVDVLLAPDHGFAPQSSSDPLLRHKTTRRAEYDRAWHEAEALGRFRHAVLQRAR